jgi:hypothetical protein
LQDLTIGKAEEIFEERGEKDQINVVYIFASFSLDESICATTPSFSHKPEKRALSLFNNRIQCRNRSQCHK